MSDEKTGAAASATEPQPSKDAQTGSAPTGVVGAKVEPTAARTPGEVLITARGLTKYYGGFTAIAGVSFEVKRGQVVAFLGPNGAGKSTTMRCLTGVLAPDRGEARIGGLHVLEHRLEVARRLGYLPENGPLYEDMTPEGLLRFFGEARGLDPARLERRIAEVRDRLDLRTVMGKAIHKLSRGFRQRVGLAQALLHEPDVLILDEPTNGLDPNQIRDVRRTIREFGSDKAVLLSTHILQEVEAIADRIVFISEGRIVFEGTVDELRASKGSKDLDAAFAAHTAAGA